MLRQVVNKHFHPRIVPFQVTVGASTASLDIGYGDFTVTRTGTGSGTLTLREPFHRNGLFFATQGTVSGGYAALDSATSSKSSFPFAIYDNGGSVANGVIEGFCFGWDSADLSHCKPQRVLSTICAPRMIWGVVSSAGVVTVGKSDFSVSVASNVFTVTFKRAFPVTPVVMVTPLFNGDSAPRVTSKSGAGCTVTLAPASGTATARDFSIIVIGNDARSDAGKRRAIVENSQRKPRIVALEATNASGSWAPTIGAAIGGSDIGAPYTDQGAGDFSIVLATPFVRQPAVVVTTTTQKPQVRSYSANDIRITTKNSSGTNADVDGVTHALMLGSDDVSEY